MSSMIVTIDGPAGSGKSAAAQGLAARLGVPYLGTGAMYRAVAYQVLQEGVCGDDASAALDVARRADVLLDCQPTGMRVRLNGCDVTDAIRSITVSRTASTLAIVRPIRDLMVDKQRAIGAALGSFVSEGRDQGSVVFPNADLKFVLEATAQRRAQRRLDELRAANQEVSFEDVLADVQRRDARDAVQWKPLLKPGAAICLDTTVMTLDEVVDRLEARVRQAVGNQRTG